MFDRCILRGQTKGVPPHGLHHIAAFKALITVDDITQRVIAYVTHVQTAARVREHGQTVKLFAFALVVANKTIVVLPVSLSVLLHLLRIVSWLHGSGSFVDIKNGGKDTTSTIKLSALASL